MSRFVRALFCFFGRHVVPQWTRTVEASARGGGVWTGTCSDCGRDVEFRQRPAPW